ncbi:MAG: hypothetical protein ACTHJZ_03730 [Trinickia sp.]|jgi:hypothetical protein|uniref:hypothetical protein n=1 Tax=Trinickia sp. TaxID=2571163 RepID=UPI002F41673D
MFKKFVAAAIVSMFATGVALAQTAASAPAAPAAAASTMKGGDCESKAVSKDGKPLSGAAKASFMKKCERDAKKSMSAQCESKAVGKDGKPLHGAAKTSSVKKCMAEAG